MNNANLSLEVIDASELAAVQGGGLFGAAWKVIDGAYHVGKAVVKDIKPVIKDLSPFGSLAYRAHSIWHKLTK